MSKRADDETVGATRSFNDLTHLADVMLETLHSSPVGDALTELDVIVYLVDPKQKLTGMGARMNASRVNGLEALAEIVGHFAITMRKIIERRPETRAAFLKVVLGPDH